MIAAKLTWNRSDLFLIIVFLLAITALLSSFDGGLTGFVEASDRPNKLYEDFQEYYQPAAKVIMHHDKPLGGYFYTPAFALFLNLLLEHTSLDPMLVWQLFQHVWLLLLLLIPGFFLAGLTGKKKFLYLYLLTASCSFSVFHNFKWGQVSLMITFLTLAALIAYQRKRPVFAALLLAIASLVKYYPGFLILGFVFKKDSRFVAVFLAWLLLLGLIIPGLILGFAPTLSFYQLSFAEMSYAVDWVAGDANSQFFAHVVLRNFGLNPDLKGFVSLVGLLLCAFVLLRGYYILRDETDAATDSKRFWQIMPMFFLLLPFILNTSWPHYFAWLPFCGLLAIHFSGLGKLRFLSIIALFLQSVFCFKLFAGYQQYSFFGLLLVANLLILANFLFVQNSFNPSPTISE